MPEAKTAAFGACMDIEQPIQQSTTATDGGAQVSNPAVSASGAGLQGDFLVDPLQLQSVAFNSAPSGDPVQRWGDDDYEFAQTPWNQKNNDFDIAQINAMKEVAFYHPDEDPAEQGAIGDSWTELAGYAQEELGVAATLPDTGVILRPTLVS